MVKHFLPFFCSLHPLHMGIQECTVFPGVLSPRLLQAMTSCNLQHALVKLPEQQLLYFVPCTSRGECSRASFTCQRGFHLLPNTPQKFYRHILCQWDF